MLLLALALLAASSGCVRDARASRVVVLGVDGLDLRLLDAQVASHALPNFERLYREGSVGPISTAEAGIPPLSPRIWTSFATGQLPAVHGMKSFVRVDESGARYLLTSRDRRVPAAWEIVSDAGLHVGVVNWWFTYPAEKVKGFVVSDRYLENWARRSARFYGAELERNTEHLVYPPDLAATLDAAVTEVKMNALNAKAAEKIDRSIFLLTYAALDAHPVDFLMIYTRALDELSHMRWSTHDPLPGETPKTDEIVDYMQRYDRLLGELLERLSPHDHLLLVSDHGFERNLTGKGPPGTHQSKESAVGTLILRGPRIRRGYRLEGAALLDFLPTALELAGVPAATNMPGRVLQEVFVPGSPKPLTRVAAYQRAAGSVDEPADATDADPATIERLKTLGYLE